MGRDIFVVPRRARRCRLQTRSRAPELGHERCRTAESRGLTPEETSVPSRPYREGASPENRAVQPTEPRRGRRIVSLADDPSGAFDLE